MVRILNLSVSNWKHIEILGCKYSIEFIDEVPSECYGYTDFENRKISIGKNADEENIRKTLIHEITHVLLHLSGQEESLSLDENQVEGLCRLFENIVDVKAY